MRKSEISVNRARPLHYAGCALVLLCAQVSVSSALPIGPGGSFPTPPEPGPVGATLLFTTGPVAWGPSVSFSGHLTSSVFINDASNPFGPGALTFTYLLSNDPTSNDSISRLSIGGFDFFQTDVSFQAPPPGGATLPMNVSRSINPVSDIGGRNVRFDFNLFSGNTSALLVIQTDATLYHNSVASVIDSVAVPNIATLAPIDAGNIPEPATVGLLLVGIGALAGARRMKR